MLFSVAKLFGFEMHFPGPAETQNVVLQRAPRIVSVKIWLAFWEFSLREVFVFFWLPPRCCRIKIGMFVRKHVTRNEGETFIFENEIMDPIKPILRAAIRE